MLTRTAIIEELWENAKRAKAAVPVLDNKGRANANRPQLRPVSSPTIKSYAARFARGFGAASRAACSSASWSFNRSIASRRIAFFS